VTPSFPKPRPRLVDRIAYKREREAKDRVFRAAVWARDAATCQRCGRRVRRILDAIPERGETHHLRGRNAAPEDRFNPDAAVLLCLLCHARAGRHE
jgi:5-methylcytosine-specific restriction endonuclease McrA